MKVFTDVNGNYVKRRGRQFEIESRRNEITIRECVLTSQRDVEEFTEALAAAARDAGRLDGTRQYKPATVRRPKDGWPIAMETK